MSYRVIHQARYWCDGCGADAIGWTDAPPPGWGIATYLCEHMSGPQKGTTTELKGHRCPACVPPSENETTRNG